MEDLKHMTFCQVSCSSAGHMTASIRTLLYFTIHSLLDQSSHKEILLITKAQLRLDSSQDTLNCEEEHKQILYLHSTLSQLNHLKQSDRVPFPILLGVAVGSPTTRSSSSSVRTSLVRWRLPWFLSGRLGKENQQRESLLQLQLKSPSVSL